jgi:hypothetical protein
MQYIQLSVIVIISPFIHIKIMTVLLLKAVFAMFKKQANFIIVVRLIQLIERLHGQNIYPVAPPTTIKLTGPGTWKMTSLVCLS